MSWAPRRVQRHELPQGRESRNGPFLQSDADPVTAGNALRMPDDSGVIVEGMFVHVRATLHHVVDDRPGKVPGVMRAHGSALRG